MTEAVTYRNQSIDLRSKSMDWFLYDNGLRYKTVKHIVKKNDLYYQEYFTIVLIVKNIVAVF